MAGDELSTDVVSPGLAAAGIGARTFTVRLWREELTGASEYRGTVREISTDAFRAFKDFSDLAAFLVARIEQATPIAAGEREEDDDVC